MAVRPAGVDDPAILEALRAYVKLLRAGKAIVARVEPRLTAHGLTVTQLGVLEAILHKGPLTQRELGRKVLTSAGNMTDVIDKLERRGLVCRSRVAGDRRSVRVALTASGAQPDRGAVPAARARHRRRDGRRSVSRSSPSSAACCASSAWLPRARTGHTLRRPRRRAHLRADRSTSNE